MAPRTAPLMQEMYSSSDEGTINFRETSRAYNCRPYFASSNVEDDDLNKCLVTTFLSVEGR